MKKALAGVFVVLLAFIWALNQKMDICTEEIKTVEFEPLNAQEMMDMIVKESKAENIKEDSIDYEDAQMLMKIAMAEAEIDGIEGQAMVMAVVLNRVNDARFPDTVKEVIFQEFNGKYQFSPVADGRYYEAEPNRDSHLALAEIEMGNYSWVDALYFDNVETSWQKENCEALYKIGHHSFYKN